jgi:hypothetical protein
VEYSNTYSLVWIITSIQILIVIITINKFKKHHINVKIAFLNGNLDEEVYLE